MGEKDPFNTLNSHLPGGGPPSLGVFVQADGHAWDEDASGELPQPCEPLSLENSYAMLYYPGATSGPWPTQYQESPYDIDHTAWNGGQVESPYQACPSNTDETLFSPHSIHYSPEASSASVCHHPQQRVASIDQQPSPMSYPQSEGFSEPTQSTPASSTTNSHSMATHPATQHKPMRPVRPKIARNPSSTQRGHAKQRSTSTGTVDLEDECGPPTPQTSSHTKERNRVAANKFRNRKRQVFAKLKVDEEALQAHHTELQSSVKDLTQEVYQLKMQLLKHSNCDCALIQNYIQNEARRYIHGAEQHPQSR